MSTSNLPGMPSPTPPWGPSPPPMDVALNYHTAGLIERFVASLIDLFILLVFAAALAFPFGILAWSAAYWTHGFGPWAALFWGPFTLVVFVLWVLYFTYLESSGGQTFGKKAMNLKVVRPATGKPPDFSHALVRNVVRIIDWLPVFYLVGLVFALLTPRKQRLGDILGDTIVVRP
jgi:uncharacterized RDD family membrane protein YckC